MTKLILTDSFIDYLSSCNYLKSYSYHSGYNLYLKRYLIYKIKTASNTFILRIILLKTQLLYLGGNYIMKKIYVYLIVFMIVGLISCKEEVSNTIKLDENNALKVDILHSAGDKWEPTDNFLPLPFNIAKGNTDEIIVLSERLDKGEKVDVKPIGAIRIYQKLRLLFPEKSAYFDAQINKIKET